MGEEDREQDRQGPHGQSDGAAWKQGKDRGWPDSQGPHQEQGWQDCQQEDECSWQIEHMDYCREEGARCLEGQGLRRHQEGHASLQEGTGVLPVSAAQCRSRKDQLQLWGFLQLLSGYPRLRTKA